MLGMEMMLKSLGLDPEEIQTGIKEFGQVIVDMKIQLDRIEHKLDGILAEKIMLEAHEMTNTGNGKDETNAERN